ncbi:MAG: transcription antitermination factor NusB [Gammaproteobacteria bacterium]|nr:transcription antitermination factor NusB [Gammaproteobacteria bacterium]
MSTPASRSRSRARRAAVQALYQWQMTGMEADEIAAQFEAEKSLRDADLDYFLELLRGVPRTVVSLDEQLQPVLDRPVAQLDCVERAILRMGAYELANRRDVPWRVVINEAVDLARTFGAEQSHRYINGILDVLARRTRADAAGGREQAG